MFGAILWGWSAYQQRRAMDVPLPGGGGGSCIVWFVGSSSIFRWDTLTPDMQPWVAHNRGVGGAKVTEIRQRFANETFDGPPEAIVFYGGENDISHGATAAQTLDQFRAFERVKAAKLPQVPMVVVSLKPSPKRWNVRPLQARYNAGMQGIVTATPRQSFVDVVPSLLRNGRPGPFFVADGIHMNPEGYKIWARMISSALMKMLPPERARRCLSAEHAHPPGRG